MSKNVAIYTLGCRLNQADAALMTGRLETGGWNIVELGKTADIDLIIINSCTVTASAARKSRQALRRFRRDYPQAKIAVTGCSVEVEDSFWQNESPDFIFDNESKKNLLDIIARADCASDAGKEQQSVFNENTLSRFPFRTRAFLKIQQGCNNFCSYCIVPYARGRERSRACSEVLRDFKNLLSGGFKEIVLTGVNVCAYSDGRRNLAELLRELSSLDGDFRIRLSSTEPHPDNRQLIEVMRDNPKICRFLHLSLQHGSNEILSAMKRRYSREEYFDFVTYAREMVEGIHIGTDLIVGFPGETAQNFADMCDFVRKVSFANIHVFSYSKRKGTPAATMPGQVAADIIKSRAKTLSLLGEEQKQNFIDSQKKQMLQVLFEQQTAKDTYCGWSDNYIKIEKKSAKNLIGKFEKCLVE